MPLDGSPLPPGTSPRVTPKVTSDIGGSSAKIRIPSWVSGPVWAEPELAVVVGKEVFESDVESAADAIFGFTIFNDSTASEHLFADPRDYFRAKSIETFSTMGPVIDTEMTNADVANGVTIRCRVNGEEKVVATTDSLKFTPAEVMSEVSRYTKLLPGDVIPLGCPPQGPAEVVAGDKLEIEIEEIGVLTNFFVSSDGSG
jgi:2-keto-4-pentenoate hydratase/2-oxohepta-3-ene-1,7-dioic acid hydratase in catechol pathway